MKIIDIHAHMGRTSSGQPVNADGLIESMNKFNIEQVGISSLSGTVTKDQNDLVYEAMCKYPDRIKGYAFINPKAPDVIEEIDRCLGEYKMSGVKFHAWKHGYVSDNTHQLKDVLKHIEKYGVHVQAHVGTSPLATPYAWIRYAKTFPNLRFVFTHMGCREFAYSVIHAVKDIENIYLKTSVIYDTDVLLKVKDLVGSKRIVFGTDWPYKSVKCEIQKIYEMGFNDEELKDVFYRNAEKLWETR